MFKNHVTGNKERLIVIEEVVSDGFDKADTFNKYFLMIVPNLGIPPKETFETALDEIKEPMLKAINKFKYHPNIKTIRSKNNPNETLSFETISHKEPLK